MKHTIIILLSISLALSIVPAFAQDAERLSSWEFGLTSITQIEDRASGFTPDIFPGARKETFAKYAVDGKISSSVSAFCFEVEQMITSLVKIEKGTFLSVEDGHVLIDAALGAPDGKLAENLGKTIWQGYKPEKVLHVFLTHMHGDHIGGLMDGDTRRFPNATVYCSEPEAEYWSTQNNALVEKVKKAYGDDFRTFSFDEKFVFAHSENENDYRVVVTTQPAAERTVFLRGFEHIGKLLDGDTRRFPNTKVIYSERNDKYWNEEDGELLEKVKKAYGDDLRMGEWRPSQVIVTPLAAAGHTPGHTAYLIESNTENIESADNRFMVIGDLLHAAALQFPHPEICAKYDVDPKEAVKARRRILDMAAEQNIPVGGIHIPKSGMGFVKKNADGGYEFLPLKKKLRVSLAEDGKAGEPFFELLETELKSGKYSIISIHQGTPASWVEKDFWEGIEKLSKKYQIPYSFERCSAFRAPVDIHFPEKE